jgi:hypothetical protein
MPAAAGSTVLLEAFATQAERVGASVHRAPAATAETAVVEIARRAGARTVALSSVLPTPQESLTGITQAAANSAGGVMGNVFFHGIAALVGLLVFAQAYIPPFTWLVVR